jgi:GTPase SAR1 family protein
VTDPISFNNVHYWLKKIKKHGDENVEIILLGNKIDLINDIAVPYEEAEKVV